ncbi:MAG: IclR family transcriptional regulator [Actinobacteria bacterium]|nr:IclR family transcriptional regulator [Actinomycetota bacterium]
MSSVKENQSVRNACILVEAVAAHQPIGVSELARRTGIDKSAAHRLAVTLHHAGWLQKTPEGRWRIAPALTAVVARAGIDSLADGARPPLEALRDATGETAMLVTVERGSLVVLDVADSPHALRITAPVGAALPIRSSSALRAIAAASPPDAVDRFRRIDPGLDDDILAETRARGWALNDREITPDTRVVGAAVVDGAGTAVAAVIVCAPSTRVDGDAIERTGALVAAAAARIGSTLGDPT